MNQTTATTTAQAVRAILGQTAYARGHKRKQQKLRCNVDTLFHKMTIKIPQDTYNRLQKFIVAENTSLSDYVANLICEDLERQQDSLRGVNEPQ